MLNKQTLLAVLLSLFFISNQNSRADGMSLMVPAYFYPSTPEEWDPLTDAALQIDLSVIVNPGNGPGDEIDSNYTAVVNNLRNASADLLGYIYTLYGERPIADVKADIDNHLLFYGPMNGFFVDEMSNENDPGTLSYYAEIYDYIKSKSTDLWVVGNPGTNTVESYLLEPCADTLVIFESDASLYEDRVFSSWTQNHSSDHFANMIWGVDSVETMQEYVQLAASRNIGHLFITDVPGDEHPWRYIPSFWQEEIDAAAAVPEPSSLFMVLAGSLLAFYPRHYTRNRN